jgi:ubiquinone biosynthesis protein
VLIVHEFTKAVNREVNLTHEKRSLRRFARSFAADPTVHIPAVYEEYCSQGVLTMEFIDGVKPHSLAEIEKAGLDARLTAQHGVNFVLRQIFELGFFHTDPHPGNLFVLPGNVLAPIDFGQVSRLGDRDRALLAELILSIVQADPARFIQALAREGMIDEPSDAGDLSHDLAEMFDVFRESTVQEIPFGRMMLQTLDLLRRHRIRPPTEFTLMVKCMMTVEGFATMLDGGFRMIDHLQPYARKLALARMSPRAVFRQARRALLETAGMLTSLPRDLAYVAGRFRRGQFQVRIHHEHLENLTRTLDMSSKRISFALIVAGLLVGSSVLITQDRGSVLGLMTLHSFGVLGYVTAAVTGAWLLISIIRDRE